jgi:xanthine dehydrogenase YagT iron-sulfur-binding subunit
MSSELDRNQTALSATDGEAEASATPTRRSFLAGVAVGGVGVAVGSTLLNGCSTTPAAQGGPSASNGVVAGPTTRPSETAQQVTLNINGGEVTLVIEPSVTLLDALRGYAGLTGTKKGCDHGQCGACTVLIDDRRVNSCLTLVMAAVGGKITTIEGLANGDTLHPMQAAFVEHDALQCGYCTPGQICSAVALIKEGHAKNDADIRELMSGNICRCGAYDNIVTAVRSVMQKA